MRTSLIIALSAIFIGCGSVQFKPVALYDKFETPPPVAKSEQLIFDDAVGTMWNSLEDCGQFEVTRDASFSGNSSIKLSWNKAECEWIGFGNSFSNWRPTDMSQQRKEKALSFYVRTQEGTVSAIPIVAALEDFSGGGSYHFIDAGKYLYGLEIDTTWKQVIVPLWDFPVFEEEVDIRAIKQMQFQLEGAGSYYLDDIRLIDYSALQYEKMRAEVELMKPKGKRNQIVYTEGKFKEDAWGYENNRCQTLTEIKEDSGNTCIKWKFNSDDCTWAKWGINWNNWYAVNFRGITDDSELYMKLKVSKGTNFRILIQDFRYHSSEFFKGDALADTEEWIEVRIPLSDLKLEEKKFALDQIKQLQFEGIASGTVYVDDIKIVQK